MSLVAKDGLPARNFGGERRFLKRAVVEWLRLGPRFTREFGTLSPPWAFDHPFWEDLFQALEKRILDKIASSERLSAKPGSKQALLGHFGVFQDDADVEAQLAGIRARREAAGE